MYSSIELTRKIYEEVLAWYNSAENKAQILLGVLGTFIGVLTAVILGKPEEIGAIIEKFSPKVIITISFTFLAILYSVFACYNCLRSRVKSKEFEKGLEGSGPYPSNRLMFFGFHVQHEPERLFESLINVRDESAEIRVYAFQIIKLSQNVAEKHKWINLGFLYVTISIFLLILTIVLYLFDLSKTT